MKLPVNIYSRTSIVIGLLVWLLISSAAQAAGQLMVAPTRVVFDSRDRTAEVNVMNTGDETASYRISFVRKRMTITGDFETVVDALPGEQFSDEMVRFSPRQIELPPGKSQTIRLLLRKPGKIADGEYRSHLLFQNVPRIKQQSIDSLAQPDGQDISITLTPIIGITIPVIVRQGTANVTTTLRQIELIRPSDKEPGFKLAFDIERDGNQSVYGDLAVFFKPKNGSLKVIGRANGVAVYTPNLVRRVRLVLAIPDGVELENGAISVEYRARPEDGDKVFAKAELLLL